MVITPKVVGESVGLHPVVVLVGITIGGTYFGFLGMVLALPATAILMVLLRRAHLLYTNSVLFHDGEFPDEEAVGPLTECEATPQEPVATPTPPKKTRNNANTRKRRQS